MPEVSRFLGIIITFNYDEHRDELIEDWNLAQAEQPLKKIEPLVQDTTMIHVADAKYLNGFKLEILFVINDYQKKLKTDSPKSG